MKWRLSTFLPHCLQLLVYEEAIPDTVILFVIWACLCKTDQPTPPLIRIWPTFSVDSVVSLSLSFPVWKMGITVPRYCCFIEVLWGNVFLKVEVISSIFRFPVNGTEQDSRRHSFKLQFHDWFCVSWFCKLKFSDIKGWGSGERMEDRFSCVVVSMVTNSQASTTGWTTDKQENDHKVLCTVPGT